MEKVGESRKNVSMSYLPEIERIEHVAKTLGAKARLETLAYSELKDLSFPIHKITFGSEDPQAPVLGFVGGVHGLERIGSQVCVSLLQTLAELVQWDQTMQRTLQKIRIFFIPTVNPVGIYNYRRANPRGVDLMRNAPVDADRPLWMVGGHRHGPLFPWYRGERGGEMEVESAALVKSVLQEISQSPLSIVLDLHSGFGLQDRLWFPYAKTIKPYPGLHQVYAFKDLMDRTYPHHFYKIEPQAQTYSTNGDLWDYMYDEQLRLNPQSIFIPLCLEMGSWMWVKKNPWQIFQAHGAFNPLIGHRHRRTLRRHNTLMEFCIRAVSSPEAWAQMSATQQISCEFRAQELWYANT